MTCKFCNGELIPMEAVGEGIKTMRIMLGMLGGEFEEEYDGIQLMEGNYLTFDNSSGEYARGAVEINYCPMCGHELKGSEE